MRKSQLSARRGRYLTGGHAAALLRDPREREAAREADRDDVIVVNCDSMGECLRVVAQWMEHGVPSSQYIRIVDSGPRWKKTLAEWMVSLYSDEWEFMRE